MWMHLAAAFAAMVPPTVSASALSALSANCDESCLKSDDSIEAVLDSMTPDSNGIIGFTSSPTFAIDLPGFSIVETIMSLSTVKSAQWKNAATGLHTAVGCSNHPALREGKSYCYYSMSYKTMSEDEKAGDKAKFATARKRGNTGKAQKKSPVPLIWQPELPESVCVAFNPFQRLISVSIEPYFGATLGVWTIQLHGATFSSHGCGELALKDYVEYGNQLKSGETFPTHLTVAGALEIGITSVLKITVTGNFAMNLDLGGTGNLSAPSAILYNLLQLDSSPVALQWGVVIQAALQGEVSLGPVSLNLNSGLQSQIFVRQTVGLPKCYITMTMSRINKLSDVLSGLSEFESVCSSAFLPDFIKESPICSFFKEEDDAPQVKIFAVIQGTQGALGIDAWGKRMLIESHSDGWKFCLGDECSKTFCLTDDQCLMEGTHCCQSTFSFKCEKFYKRKDTGHKISCLDLLKTPDAFRVDPMKAAKEGEGCTLDSDCGIDLHCCSSSLDFHCRKVQKNKITGIACSCAVAETGACDEAASTTCISKAVNACIALGLLLFHVAT